MKTKNFLFLLAIIFFVFCLISCDGGSGGDDPDPPAPKPWLCFPANIAGSSVSTRVVENGDVSAISVPSLEYSIDGGTKWNSFALSYYVWGTDNLITEGTTIPLGNGEKVYIRATGQNDNFSWESMTETRIVTFKLTGSIAASGNIMSLVNKNCETKEIPSSSIGYFCCLFEDCLNLTSAPELPATTLAIGCYDNMFVNCGLTVAPELPATTLADACYYSMFVGCTSLTTAPELPATVLTDRCYYDMFRACEALNKITVKFTSWSPANATTNWVDDVAPTGTFICPAGLDTSTPGINANPASWAVQNLP